MAETIITGLVKLGASKTLAVTVSRLALSVGLSAGSAYLQRPRSSDDRRELPVPTTQPAYRFVYGRGARVPGTPAPFSQVSGNYLYGCLILNSRPSDGRGLRITIDEQEVGLSGDATDFGDYQQGTATIAQGATSVTFNHGLGGQPVLSGVRAWRDDDEAVTVTSLTATQITVAIGAAAPSGGVAINWRAVFARGGGVAINAPFAGYFECWLGRGDQTHPPAKILQEYGDLRGLNTQKFWPTDRWSGLTVLWVRCLRSATIWRSRPPAIQVEMDWSRVYDPRDAAQDADDPDTWQISDNQALCLMDFLRQNPLARYPLSQIDQAQLIAGANVADQRVRLKSGGTEPRYRVGGTVIFQQARELADLVVPLEQAGAGRVTRTGGRLGYRPGIWNAPEVTLGEHLADGPVRFTVTSPPESTPAALRCSYVDPRAGWELTELRPYQIAANWDQSPARIEPVELSMVNSATQAMRVQQIMARRRALPRRLEAVWPPSAIECAAGMTVTYTHPTRATARENGTYEIESVAGGSFLQDDQSGGVTFRLPMVLVQDAATVYDWDPQTDEQPLFDQNYVAPDPSMPRPLSVTTELVNSDSDLRITATVDGVWVDTGIPTFEPVARADLVEHQYRINQGPWQSAGQQAVSPSEEQETTLPGVTNPASYDARVRFISNQGDVSAWVYRWAQPVGITLGAPTLTASPGSARVDLTITAPADSACAAVQLWFSASGVVDDAVFIDEQTAPPSAVRSYAHTDLTPGQALTYFARAVTDGGAVGPWSSGQTATPTA